MKTTDSKNLNYFRSSWVSYLQNLEQWGCWDTFCPWLWSTHYVYSRLDIKPVAISSYQPSSFLMPFYLHTKLDQPRRFLIRVKGTWLEQSDLDFTYLQQQIDQLTQSKMICVELVLMQKEWRLLQLYPGLPWAHFLEEQDSFMPILEQVYWQLISQSEFTIPLSHRPFCNYKKL